MSLTAIELPVGDEKLPDGDDFRNRKILPIANTSGLPNTVVRGWACLEDMHDRDFPSLENFDDPVPVGRVGPIMFMAHYDIEYDFEGRYNMDLVQPCWVHPEVYSQATAEISNEKDFVKSIFGETTFPTPEPLPPSQTVSDERDREIVDWYMLNADMDEGLRGPGRQALERTQPVRDSLASTDWIMILDFQNSRELFATIDIVGQRCPIAEEKHGLDASRSAALKIVPFFSTETHLFCLTNLEENTASEDFLISSRIEETVYVRAPETSILAANLTVKNETDEIDFESQEDFIDAAFSVNGDDFIDFDPLSSDITPATNLHWLMCNAAEQGASDVHIDLFQGYTRVRFSIDGELEVFQTYPRDQLNTLASVIKNVAGVDMSSQDHSEGRFSFRSGERVIDIRLGILYEGNSRNKKPRITMRLLDRSRGAFSLSQLGLDFEELQIIKRAYTRRYGLILVSGGTGQGKSTTLSAIQKELAFPSNACFTLEDPIEINIDGVSQVEAKGKADELAGHHLSFHEGLERLLRMDPDVITVGEIRDAKTAEVTPKAALTGHLVLSTVHTNDAITVISRMLGFGVDPFDLAQSLTLASSQVLVRRLCSCSKSVRMKPAQRAIFENAGVEITSDYIPVPHGCAACRKVGYRSRRVVMEMMEITPEIQDAIMEEKTPSEIRRIAISQGYKTIFQKGLEMVMRGETSLEEVMKHAGHTQRAMKVESDS